MTQPKLTELLDIFFLSEFSESLSSGGVRLCDDLSIEKIKFQHSSISDFEKSEHTRLISQNSNEGSPNFTANLITQHTYRWLSHIEVEEVKRRLIFFPA